MLHDQLVHQGQHTETLKNVCNSSDAGAGCTSMQMSTASVLNSQRKKSQVNVQVECEAVVCSQQ